MTWQWEGCLTGAVNVDLDRSQRTWVRSPSITKCFKCAKITILKWHRKVPSEKFPSCPIWDLLPPWRWSLSPLSAVSFLRCSKPVLAMTHGSSPAHHLTLHDPQTKNDVYILNGWGKKKREEQFCDTGKLYEIQVGFY